MIAQAAQENPEEELVCPIRVYAGPYTWELYHVAVGNNVSPLSDCRVSEIFDATAVDISEFGVNYRILFMNDGSFDLLNIPSSDKDEHPEFSHLKNVQAHLIVLPAVNCIPPLYGALVRKENSSQSLSEEG